MSTIYAARLGKYLIDSSACGGIEVPLSTDTGATVFALGGVNVIVGIKSYSCDDEDLGSCHREFVQGEMNGG
jgi:hypothetical protein